jgi:hypothetical protein
MIGTLVAVFVPLLWAVASTIAGQYWYRNYDWNWKKDKLWNSAYSLLLGLAWPVMFMLVMVMMPDKEQRDLMKKVELSQRIAKAEADLEAATDDLLALGRGDDAPK